MSQTFTSSKSMFYVLLVLHHICSFDATCRLFAVNDGNQYFCVEECRWIVSSCPANLYESHCNQGQSLTSWLGLFVSKAIWFLMPQHIFSATMWMKYSCRFIVDDTLFCCLGRTSRLQVLSGSRCQWQIIWVLSVSLTLPLLFCGQLSPVPATLCRYAADEDADSWLTNYGLLVCHYVWERSSALDSSSNYWIHFYFWVGQPRDMGHFTS